MDYLSNEFFFEGSRLVHIKLYFDVHKVQLFMVFRYKSLSQLSHQKTNMVQNLKYLLCNFTTTYSLRRPFCNFKLMFCMKLLYDETNLCTLVQWYGTPYSRCVSNIYIHLQQKLLLLQLQEEKTQNKIKQKSCMSKEQKKIK